MNDPRPIRHAASMIVARPGVDGPQILAVQRGSGSRFLAGYVVFPGGAVDAEDATLARRWFGDPGEAARAAAIRELVEEAGLALTATGLVDAGDPDSLEPTDAAPPSIGQLPETTHWIAPEDVPVRFDARYFAVAAPAGLEPVADGAEAELAWWESPRSLLAGWAEGDRKLYWPTYFTMLRLATCETVDDVLALRFETREADEAEVDSLPPSVFWEE
ncbi:MAG: NUDIX domain-containing protein [Actinomycetota bacterium]